MNNPARPETVTSDDIEAAAGRIAKYAVRTPLLPAVPMSQRCGASVFIKAEHRQRTGSFKIRGALNKTFGLSDADAAHGVITASSGNHGIGVATAAAARGIPCTVYLPSGASPSKIAAIDRLGATIVTVDDADTAVAERTARATATDQLTTFISPYNDAAIVAGQGTIGREIAEDWPLLEAGPNTAGRHAGGPDAGGPIDAVVVAVGGGGLISGIATWIKEYLPETVIVGASPANDLAMAASVEAGKIIEPRATATFSDGTAGAVEAGSITFPICSALVDEWMAISETAIATAVTDMIDDHHELVEGSAGVALAAAAQYGAANPDARIVVVSCGANVSSAAVSRMLAAAAER